MVLRHAGCDYGENPSLTLSKVSLRLLPTSPSIVTIARKMKLPISAYSIAVAPFSSAKNVFSDLITTSLPICGNSLRKIARSRACRIVEVP